MNNESAESGLRAEGGMPAALLQSGGGSAGAEETEDVSDGHVVCSRSDGPTEPGTPPAKSPPRTAREFERVMRELGYSKRQAREIVSHGFKGLTASEFDDDTSEQLAALMKRIEQIERNVL